MPGTSAAVKHAWVGWAAARSRAPAAGPALPEAAGRAAVPRGPGTRQGSCMPDTCHQGGTAMPLLALRGAQIQSCPVRNLPRHLTAASQEVLNGARAQ